MLQTQALVRDEIVDVCGYRCHVKTLSMKKAKKWDRQNIFEYLE
jgi:hypothetical protein